MACLPFTVQENSVFIKSPAVERVQALKRDKLQSRPSKFTAVGLRLCHLHSSGRASISFSINSKVNTINLDMILLFLVVLLVIVTVPAT